MSLWLDLLGAETRHVRAGGVTTRVVTLGTGPPVVFLHGRGGHLETFARNLPAVAAAGRRAVAFDLLGHGLTGRPAHGRYGVDDLADHAAAVLTALELDRPGPDRPGLDGPDLDGPDLVGQSLGGWVAALLALRGRTGGRLVLIEPAGLQSERERLADAAVRAAYERGGRAYAEPTPDAVRTRLAGLLADPGSVDSELVDVRTVLYRPAEARRVHRRVRAADNEAALLTPERLRALTVPVMFVRGEHGHTPSGVVARAAAAVPDARVLTIPDCRQWPQFERPDVVNAALTAFLPKEQPHDLLD